MQVHSIISNTITEEVRQKGHQSIRIAPDGFSVFISNASYRPVFLSHYGYTEPDLSGVIPRECERILNEMELVTFEGETIFILDSAAVTMVPEKFFEENRAGELLRHAGEVADTDQVRNRVLKDRPLVLVYAVSQEVASLAGLLRKEVKILHTLECLISLSDQVRASDHQRGVVLVEIQPRTMDILVIMGDGIRLSNHYTLKDPADFIYHTLNTFRQLELDREMVPVYLSGIIHREHELFGLLGKYVRNVNTTPYFLEELSREDTLRAMILSEGSKCA
ncbi:MAG TPA: DUF3822 family protein [Bacteroides sp.]|nr:DUF3822 family protein [Bacteroides sp.]